MKWTFEQSSPTDWHVNGQQMYDRKGRAIGNGGVGKPCVQAIIKEIDNGYTLQMSTDESCYCETLIQAINHIHHEMIKDHKPVMDCFWGKVKSFMDKHPSDQSDWLYIRRATPVNLLALRVKGVIDSIGPEYKPDGLIPYWSTLISNFRKDESYIGDSVGWHSDPIVLLNADRVEVDYFHGGFQFNE